MPRAKKSTKVTLPSLQNCSIAFAGTSIPSETFPNDSLADVKSKISSNGGSFVTKVAECTHLCATEAQFNKGLVKVEEAKSNSAVKIVSFEWLAAALDSDSPVDETSYLHSDGSATVVSKQPDASQQPNGTSKKRGRNATKDAGEDTQTDTKKAKTSTKTATTKALNVPSVKVPLDDGLSNVFKVWIGDDGTIYDATLNQSDSGANANKFYRCQLLQNTTTKTFSTWTRWGRVGEPGQNSMLGDGSFDDALRQFNKKFKDKTGNSWDDRNAAVKAKKYVFIERSYDESDNEDDGAAAGASTNGKSRNGVKEEDDDSKGVESKLAPPVQRLMRLIFNQEYFNNTFTAFDYDSKKMPLGKLSKSSLLRGYETLKELAALVSSGTNQAQIKDLSNTYLSLIPKVIPRSSRPPVLDNMSMIKKELELLEALTDMKLANDLMKGAKQAKEYAEELNLLDRQFAGLNLKEMTSLESSSTEFKECHEYLDRTVGATHGTNYKVQNIFRIQRTGEKERFDSSPYATRADSDRRLLWHGSRVTNFGGILGQGLRIAPPEAPVSGYMFAKGIYLADMSSKSAGYCCSWNSGGTGLLLLCEAELGKPPLKLTGADSSADQKAKAQGMISTWGVGRTAPQVWKDAGCIHPDLKGVSMPDMASKDAGDTNEPGAGLFYNEYIVYDVAQVKLRYLLMVEM